MGSMTKIHRFLSLYPSTQNYNPILKINFSKLTGGLPGAYHHLLRIRNITTTPEPDRAKLSVLLDRLRTRCVKHSSKLQRETLSKHDISGRTREDGEEKKKKRKNKVGSFEELGLSNEVIAAVRDSGIEAPTEIQCVGVPPVLEGKNVVLASHTGSGKTLAYLLPIVQLLRQDEASNGMIMKPGHPRAIVLCPTRELSEQVLHVAKSICHHARFRSTLISGGGLLKPQKLALSSAIDMVIGTPGRVLQHINDKNLVYGDIRHVVLDEADTMFDHGFGPDIRKFLDPLKNRASKPAGQKFQIVLVAATMTKAVQKLVDEEFQGILHLRTSSLHKKIASCGHNFTKLSGSEDKLDALLQVLEPSLTKGDRVMVFCNTLNSSRAVDHFLSENHISTVNYHGEVPAKQRVENLKKFKSDDGDCPTLVCTDLAARGLHLDVDHVINFDFPMNSIDYLHRTGRTARMGAKGKVTSLVAKKDVLLAIRIEQTIQMRESLESINVTHIKKVAARTRTDNHNSKRAKSVKTYKKMKKSEASVARMKKKAPVWARSKRGVRVHCAMARKTTGSGKQSKKLRV